MARLRSLLAALAALPLAVGGLAVPAQAAAPTDQIPAVDAAASCTTAGNVWVVVQTDVGDPKGGCATAFSTGLEALTSAGFAVEAGGGFVNRIDGYPATPNAYQAYWSYWVADPATGGTWGYASTGAGSYKPKPGTIQGWHFAKFTPGVYAGPPTWAWSDVQPDAAGLFTPVLPTRVHDSRAGMGVRIPGKSEIQVDVASWGAVPADARAVTLQVTVPGTPRPSFLTVYAPGPRPHVSTMNLGQTDRANQATVRVADGKIAFFNDSPDDVDLVVDLTGYYRAAPAVPGAFVPVTPSRALDTREGGGIVAPGSSVRAQVAPAGQAGAVLVNLNATAGTADGHLRIAASGVPETSAINYLAGEDRANMAIVHVAADGSINVHNGGMGSVHAIVDVVGYFLPGTAAAKGAYVASPGARLLDTRACAGCTALQGVGAAAIVPFKGQGGVPADGNVGAVVANLTAVDGTVAGWGRLAPYTPVVVQPAEVAGRTWSHSSVNFDPGTTVANLTTTGALERSLGWLELTHGAPGATHYVVDLQGWYLA